VVQKFKEKENALTRISPRRQRHESSTRNLNEENFLSLDQHCWDGQHVETFPLKAFLSLKVEDVAMSHFLSSHVCGSHFSYLPEVYKTKGDCITLSTSVRAAAMAAFSRELKEPETMWEARKHYSQAIVLTNQALANPRLAVLDSTLISVLLLSLFETVAQESRDSPTNWYVK
jgi:hypothetical protein